MDLKVVRTSVVTLLGGGVAASIAAAFDPQKYNIMHDLGSGKLWKFFFGGAGAAFLAMLLQSKFGQQMMDTYKSSQRIAADAKAGLGIKEPGTQDKLNPQTPVPQTPQTPTNKAPEPSGPLPKLGQQPPKKDL